jgi:SpoVK/Ycf46/Vps4 family AAA+-type ATPase
VIEELTERTGHTGTEKLLSFLDGETSWNNSYVVATTNYPDELPWNIIDRPGRFGTIVEVKNPTKEQRMSYMKIMALNLEELEEAADATEGLCFDYVKCTVLDALDNGTSVKEEVQKYKERREKVSKAFKSTKLGLGE